MLNGKDIQFFLLRPEQFSVFFLSLKKTLAIFEKKEDNELER